MLVLSLNQLFVNPLLLIYEEFIYIRKSGEPHIFTDSMNPHKEWRGGLLTIRSNVVRQLIEEREMSSSVWEKPIQDSFMTPFSKSVSEINTYMLPGHESAYKK